MVPHKEIYAVQISDHGCLGMLEVGCSAHSLAGQYKQYIEQGIFKCLQNVFKLYFNVCKPTK